MTFEETTTDMGLLSLLAYKSLGTSPIVKVSDGGTPFQQFEYENKIYTLNSSYSVIDYSSSGHGMEAVLLRNDTTGQFVIAFRGTQEPEDYVYDVTTGVLNYNPQRSDAELFVQKALNNPNYDINASNLTLTGHSLGGILAQTIASTQNLEAYTFNALGTTGLTRFENPNDESYHL